MRILITVLTIVGVGTVLWSPACNDSMDRAGATAGGFAVSAPFGDADGMFTRIRAGSASLCENPGPLSVLVDDGRERHCSVLFNFETPSAESLCSSAQSADTAKQLANQRR